MKISKLDIKNFAKFADISVEFDNKHTRLIGLNGSGKSTFLTAIWAALKGIALKNTNGQIIADRYRFLYPGAKSADIELELIDELTGAKVIIKRHFTTSTSKLTFETDNPDAFNDEWVNGLLSVAFMSAKNFTSLSGKEQALLFGIDVEEFDSRIKEVSLELTEENRELKRLDSHILSINEPPVIEKKVDLSEIKTRRDAAITEFNSKLKEREKEQKFIAATNNQVESAKKEIENFLNRIKTNIEDIEQFEAQIKTLQSNIHKSREEITELTAKIEDVKNWLNNNPVKESLPEIESIDLSIFDNEQSEGDRINKAYEERQKYESLIATRTAQQEKINSLIAKKNGLSTDRLEYIRRFDFPFSGISVDADGGLLYKERQIKPPYFSQGELEIIVAKLAASRNPELKTRFLDDFDLLDTNNQKEIIEYLIGLGFQVITAEVGMANSQKGIIALSEDIKGTETKPDLL